MGAGAAIRWQLDPTNGVLFGVSRAFASAQLPRQTPLDGARIPQFVTALTTFGGQRVKSASIDVGMFEFQQRVLPDSIYNRLPSLFNAGTFLWGYDVAPDNTRRSDRPSPSWPGTIVEAQRNTKTTITYTNNLRNDSQLRKLLTIDETIHWADPLNAGHSFNFYTGPIPTVVHLHGAEDQSTSDGHSQAWFTNDGRHGRGYFTAAPTSPNGAVYPPQVFNGAPNPGIHPFWIPEFFGDVVCVNGRSWPFLNVEPRRYRFRIVNGSNARFYRMRLPDARTLAPGCGPAI